MRSHILYSLLLVTAATATLTPPEAMASPQVNVSINGYLPAPPGVVVQVAAGRPYYVKNERRVYLVKEKHRHGKKQHREGHGDGGHRHDHERHGRGGH